MKYIALLLLALLVAGSYGVAVPTAPMPKTQIDRIDDNGVVEAIEVVGGFLVGAFAAHSSIKECFDDAQGIFQDFQNAYASLRSQNQKGVEDGFVHIGRALLKVPNAVKDCKFAGDILNKVRSVATKFSNPVLLVVTVGKNIIWHSVSIFREVKSAIAAYEHQEWFSFGMAIGGIADMVLLRNTHYQDQLKSSGSEFLNGFAHGVDPQDYNDVATCIHDLSATTWNRIEKDIKDLSWKHISRSVKDIEDIGKVFVAAIKDCKTGGQAVANLVYKLSTAFTAGNFIEAALNIVKNPIKFVQLIEKTVKDFGGHRYFAAGEDIGTFVGEVLHLRLVTVEDLVRESM